MDKVLSLTFEVKSAIAVTARVAVAALVCTGFYQNFRTIAPGSGDSERMSHG
jgi:hypothetical protein